MAKETMNHQIAAITEMDIPAILDDYSSDLVAIAYLCGNTKVVGYKSLRQLVESLIQLANKLGLSVEKSMKKMQVLYQSEVNNYAVIAIQLKPFVPFAVFSCVVNEGKANYVTGYAKTIKLPALGMQNETILANEATVNLITKHFNDLKEMNKAELLLNYDNHAVVLSNCSSVPFIGKNQIHEYCTQLVHSSDWMNTLFSSKSVVQVKEMAEDLACIVLLNKQTKKICVLTYLVKQGRIVFESSLLYS